MPARPARSQISYRVWIGIIVFLAVLLLGALFLLSQSDAGSDPLPTLVSFPASATPLALSESTRQPDATVTPSPDQAAASVNQSAATSTEAAAIATLAPSATVTDTIEPATVTPSATVTDTSPVVVSSATPIIPLIRQTRIASTPSTEATSAAPTASATGVTPIPTATGAPVTQPEGSPFSGTLEIGSGTLYVLQVERNASARLQQAGITLPALASGQEWVLLEMMFVCPNGVQCSPGIRQIALRGASGQQYTPTNRAAIEPIFTVTSTLSGQTWGYLVFISQRSENPLWVTISAASGNFYYGG